MPRSRWSTALVAAVLTAVVGLVGYNFIGGEKRIETRLERLYGIDAPGFERELGVLPGPPVVGGKVHVLLDAVGSAKIEDAVVDERTLRQKTAIGPCRISLRPFCPPSYISRAHGTLR